MLPLALLIAGLENGIAFMLGFIAMYKLYEVLHRRAHTHPPRSRYGRWQRKNDFARHVVDPRLAQSVATPVWEKVFGTPLSVERARRKDVGAAMANE